MKGKDRLAKLDRVEVDTRRELLVAMRRARGDVAEAIARAARDRRIATSERRRMATFSAIGGFYDRLEREITAAVKDAAYRTASLFHDTAVEDIRAARGRVAQAVVMFDRRRVDAVWSIVAPEMERHLVTP